MESNRLPRDHANYFYYYKNGKKVKNPHPGWNDTFDKAKVDIWLLL